MADAKSMGNAPSSKQKPALGKKEILALEQNPNDI
jgi:hypothetical protein